MANADKNIVITPNRGQSGLPEISFTGFGNVPITLKCLDDAYGTLSFEASSGQLLSINNNLTDGTIFSVNDISGIPSIRVDADGTIGFAEYMGNIGIGTSSPTAQVHQVATTASTVGHIIQQHSTPGDFVQYKDYLGNILASIDASGNITATSISSSGNIFESTAIGDVPLIVRGFAGQTAALTQWQNSSQTVLSSITANGSFTHAATTANPAITISHSYNSDVITVSKGGGTGVVFNATGTSGQTSGMQFDSTDVNAFLFNSRQFGFSSTYSTGIDSFGVYGAYLDIAQTRNTAGTNGGRPVGVYARVSTTALAPRGYGVWAVSNSARSVPFVAQAHSGQTESLQEWQNSSGTVLAKVNASGHFSADQYNFVSATGYLGVGATSTYIRGTTIYLDPSGNLSDAVRINNTELAPYDTSTLNLGRAATPWQTIYGNNLTLSHSTFTGTCSAYISANNTIQFVSSALGSFFAVGPGNSINTGAQALYSLTRGAIFGNTAGTVPALSVNSGMTAVVTSAIKATASQTADLTQWQNSSATALATVSSKGVISAPTFNCISYSDFTSVANGAADFQYGYISTEGTYANAFFTMSASVAASKFGMQGAAGDVYIAPVLGQNHYYPSIDIFARGGTTGMSFSVYDPVSSAFTWTKKSITAPTTTYVDNFISTPLMVLTGEGRLGIGTSNPTEKLDVVGNIKLSGNFLTVASPYVQPYSSNSNLNFTFYPSGTATQTALSVFGKSSATDAPWGQLQHVGTELRINSGANGVGTIGDIAFYANGERVRIDSDTGNVGIGATIPGQKLEVNGNILLGATTSILYLGNDSDQYITGNATSNYLAISTGNQERVRVISSGNVGIGETGPAAKLEINTTAAATVGLIVQAAASQTANLTEWQNSSETVLSYITSTGKLVVPELQVTPTASNTPFTLTNGDSSTGSANRVQVAFGYNGGTTYSHFITTRHNNGVSDDNSINFYTSDGTAAGVYPTNAVLGMSINGGKVGIATTDPSYTFHLVTNNTGTGESQFAITNNAATTTTKTWRMGVGASGNYEGYLKFIGANAASQNDWVVAFIDHATTTSRVVTTPGRFSAASFGSNVTGLGDIGLIRWSGTGSTASGTLKLGLEHPYGDHGVDINLSKPSGDTGNVAGTKFRIRDDQNSLELFSTTNQGKTLLTTVAAAITPLTVKAAASQTANLTEWQNSSGTVLSCIDENGNLGIGDSDPGAKLEVVAGAAADKGISIQGAASHTGNLFEIKDSSGNVKVFYNPTATAPTTFFSIDTFASLAGNGSNRLLTVKNNGTEAFYVGDPGGAGTVSNQRLTSGGTSSNSGPGFIWNNFLSGAQVGTSGEQAAVKIASTIQQTTTAAGHALLIDNTFVSAGSGGAYLVRARNSATERFSVSYDGATKITIGSTSAKGLVIQAVASQTANLQEWQNSSGTALAYVDKDGYASFSGGITTGNAKFISLTRTIPVVVNDVVQIGSFAFTNGAGDLSISIIVPSTGFSVAKKYHISSKYGFSSSWSIVLPDHDTGAYSGLYDMQLEAVQTAGTLSLRIRRTAGTVAGTAYITIVDNGASTTSFTPSTATSTEATTSLYFPSTALVNLGSKVGIGISVPTAHLHQVINAATTVGHVIKSASSQTANLTEWQDSAGTVLSKIASDGKLTVPTFAMTTGASNGYVLTSDGSGNATWQAGGGSGTVTSVGLALPSIFTVSGSPVTTSGTLTGTLASQTANTVFVAPNGSAGAPTFRALVKADLPSTVAHKDEATTFTSTLAASNLSGTNTGDQTITLTGDVTGSGTGSFAATIASSVVTFAKMQNITTGKLLGRSTASTGVIEELSVGTGLSLSAGTLTSTITQTNSSGIAGAVQFSNGSNGFSSDATNFFWNDTDNRLGIKTGSPGHELQIGTVTSTATATPVVLSLGGTYSSTAGSNLKLRLYDPGVSSTSYGLGVSASQLDFVAPASAGQGFFVNGSASPTLTIKSTSLIGIGMGSSTPGAQVEINTSSASTIGLIVQGTSSQTANLTEWQNSSSTVLASVSSSGGITAATLTVNGRIQINDTFAVRIGSDAGGGTTGDTVAIGYRALYSNTTTINHVVIGSQALYSKTNSGNGCIAIGYQSQYNATSGAQNVSVGNVTFTDITTGSSNTAIGHNTGKGITTGSYNTIIGANVTGLSTTLANTVIIADGQGNKRIYIDSDGEVGLGTESPGARLEIETGSTTRIGLIVQAIASQTANLTEWQDSAGTVLSKIASDGKLTVPTFAMTTGASNGYVLTSDGSGNATWQAGGGGGSGTVTSVGLALPSIFTVSGSPVTTSGTLTGTLASQTANTVFVAPNGSAGAPTFRALVKADLPSTVVYNDQANNITGGTQTITSNAVGTKPLIIKAAASQTANLTEWQDSSSTALSYVTNGGEIYSPKLNATPTAAAGSFTVGLVTKNNGTGTNSGTASGLEVRGWNDVSSAEVAWGRVGFRRWSGLADGRYGEFVVHCASSGTVPSTPTLTLDVNGILTVGTFKATATMSAGTYPIALHYSASGTAPSNSIMYHGLWAKDNLDMVFKAGGAHSAVLSWDGRFGVGTDVRTSFTSKFAVIGGSNIVTSVFKANASQTANLTEWQDSTGTVLSKIASDGKLTVPTFAMTTGASNGYVLTSDASGNATWQAGGGSGSGKIAIDVAADDDAGVPYISIENNLKEVLIIDDDGIGPGNRFSYTDSPTFESLSESGDSYAGTSFTINKPTGTTSGDLLILIVAADASGTPGWSSTGFTVLESDSRSAVLYKTAGGSEPASYTVSGTYIEASAIMYRFSGTNAIESSDITYVNADTAATQPDPGFLDPGSLYIVWGYGESDSLWTNKAVGNPNPATGWNSYHRVDGSSALLASYQIFDSEGQPGAITHDHTSAYTTISSGYIIISGTTGTSTDSSGIDLVLHGGPGTGTGNGGDIVLRTAPASGSSGTTINTQVNRVTIDSDGNVILHSIPSSDPNIAGAIYKDGSNFLKVSTG